jgi:hypothetical protein
MLLWTIHLWPHFCLLGTHFKALGAFRGAQFPSLDHFLGSAIRAPWLLAIGAIFRSYGDGAMTTGTLWQKSALIRFVGHLVCRGCYAEPYEYYLPFTSRGRL